MQVDRRSTKGFNILTTSVILIAVGGFAWILTNKKKEDRLASFTSERTSLLDERKGYAAEDRGQFLEAEAWYARALKQKPQGFNLKLALARTLAAQDKRKEAWELYGQIPPPPVPTSRRAGIAHDDPLAWYADLADTAGDKDRALTVARSIVPPTAKPQDAQRLFALAHLYGARELYRMPGAALGHARRAAALDPDRVFPRLTHAAFLLLLKQDDAANAEYIAAQKLAAKGTAADLICLARYDATRLKRDAARKEFEQAARRIQPTDTATWLDLYLSADKYHFPDLAQIALQQICAHMAVGDGRSMLRLAEAADPSNGPLALLLTEAARCATPPQNTPLYREIAFHLLNMRREYEALTMLIEARTVAAKPAAAELERVITAIVNPGMGSQSGTGFVLSNLNDFRAWLESELDHERVSYY